MKKKVNNTKTGHKRAPNKSAADMVQPRNRIVVLAKQPELEQLPSPAEKIVAVIEELGGQVKEAELIPALEKKLPGEPVHTLWGYWRGKLEQMGILAIKDSEQ